MSTLSFTASVSVLMQFGHKVLRNYSYIHSVYNYKYNKNILLRSVKVKHSNLSWKWHFLYMLDLWPRFLLQPQNNKVHQSKLYGFLHNKPQLVQVFSATSQKLFISIAFVWLKCCCLDAHGAKEAAEQASPPMELYPPHTHIHWLQCHVVCEVCHPALILAVEVTSLAGSLGLG